MAKHLKALALPVLFSVTPIIFLYSHNIKVLVLENLPVPLISAAAAALALYGLFYLFYRNTLSASLSAVILLSANYLYGTLYDGLVKLNIIQVLHFVLLPVVIYLAFYAAYFFNFLKSGFREGLQKILTVMVLGLVIFNVVTAVPAELEKAHLEPTTADTVSAASTSGAVKKPDVYFIILDEYAGLEASREYFHADYVDGFEKFLKDSGFIVFKNPQSFSTSTNLEVAGRLNLKHYPDNTEPLKLTEAIINNKVMDLFKDYGYTTVAFNGPFPKYYADYNIKFSTGAKDDAVGAAEFEEVLIQSTMLAPFSDLLKSNDSSARELGAIKKTFEKISDLGDIPSPKLVTVHILMPHVPFITDAEGNPLDPKYQYNWNYYLGQHEFVTRQTQALLQRMLDKADPANPPVIIVQSDHGARNHDLPSRDSVTLKDYPGKYAKNVLFAMYLPGADTSDLPGKVRPVDSLAVVLNKYLNAGVSVEELPAQ